MIHFHEFLHTMYRYVLNSVVKISMMFVKYFEYCIITLREGGVFCGHVVYYVNLPLASIGLTYAGTSMLRD